MFVYIYENIENKKCHAAILEPPAVLGPGGILACRRIAQRPPFPAGPGRAASVSIFGFGVSGNSKLCSKSDFKHLAEGPLSSGTEKDENLQDENVRSTFWKINIYIQKPNNI